MIAPSGMSAPRVEATDSGERAPRTISCFGPLSGGATLGACSMSARRASASIRSCSARARMWISASSGIEDCGLFG